MAGVQDVGDRYLEALEFVERQVDAAAPRILADVVGGKKPALALESIVD